ncbi:hypothetical protein [Undibacterium sp. SXout20W]|uniref:hypothetical protein n=1 Tax=Undibacterium sp. SXout20W TaxID=3413051 RepID=UPI003BF2F2EB
MSKLIWSVIPTNELSTMLVDAELEKSTALGSATVYHFQHDGQEKMAVALADGQTLVIETMQTGSQRRRRIDNSV